MFSALLTLVFLCFCQTSVPVVPVAKVSSGPSKIPSRAVQEFMGKVSSLGRQLETLALENGENGDLSHRMDVMTKVLDDLTSFFNDAAVRLNEHEHILEERLHVVEEGLLVVERCSDPQFLECLRNLPLDPLQRRKFEVLEKNIKELEHKLKTIDKAIDIELDVMEEKRASPEDDQFVVARKLIKELDTTSLHLQKKLSEIERESRRLALKEPQRATGKSARMRSCFKPPPSYCAICIVVVVLIDFVISSHSRYKICHFLIEFVYIQEYLLLRFQTTKSLLRLLVIAWEIVEVLSFKDLVWLF